MQQYRLLKLLDNIRYLETYISHIIINPYTNKNTTTLVYHRPHIINPQIRTNIIPYVVSLSFTIFYGPIFFAFDLIAYYR